MSGIFNWLTDSLDWRGWAWLRRKHPVLPVPDQIEPLLHYSGQENDVVDFLDGSCSPADFFIIA